MKLICILTILGLSTPPTGTSQNAPLQALMSEPEIEASYAIYSMVIGERLAKMSKNVRVFINNMTKTEASHSSCLKPVAPNADTRYDEAIASYFFVNKTPRPLEHRFNLGRVYEFATGDLAKYVDPNTTDAGFRVVFFASAVGFNSDRSRAVVYIAHVCGGLCGQGAVVFVVKENGKWTYDRTAGPAVCMWVS